MATKLSKPVEREVNIPGISKPVIISIDKDLVTARVKGSRHVVFASWGTLVKAMHTHNDVPSFLAGKPMELLAYKAKGK